MSLARYLSELADPEKELTAAGLTRLSGLLGAEVDELCEGWLALPAERRLDLISRLVDLAEENPELDFYAVFCHGLNDDDPGVRERAVSGLWESDDRRTIPRLIERLEADESEAVRAAAASVLGHFGDLADEGKLVARDGERVYQALVNVVEDSEEPLEVRRRALEAVAPFRSPEVGRWLQWGYASNEPLLRQSAVHAMGRSGDPQWLPVIYQEMTSTDPAMRYEAANAARDMGEEEAVAHLAMLAHDADPQVASAALHAIAVIGGTEAKQYLRRIRTQARDTVLQDAAQEALESMLDEDGEFSLFRLEAEN